MKFVDMHKYANVRKIQLTLKRKSRNLKKTKKINTNGINILINA